MYSAIKQNTSCTYFQLDDYIQKRWYTYFDQKSIPKATCQTTDLRTPCHMM